MQYHVSYYLTEVSKPSDIERAYGYWKKKKKKKKILN